MKRSRQKEAGGMFSVQQSGFTLIELAVVLIMIGLITGAAIRLYHPAQDRIDEVKAEQILLGIKQSLISFAISHRRLPCADTNSNGFEGGAAGCGAAATAQTGSVPYATLGIDLPGTPGQEIFRRDIVYGVYRNNNAIPASDADLAIVLERTGDLLGDSRYQDLGDFRRALTNGATAATSSNFVYRTGDGDTSAENCGTNVVANAAFLLASAGTQDANLDGNRFDGVNEALNLDGSGAKCFASAAKRRNADYDDVTVGMGFTELLSEVIGRNK